MSKHTYYQALPRQGSLFRRLENDGAFHTLYAHLTLLGPGPFYPADLEAAEVDDTLASLTGRGRCFGSRAEADRVLAELRQEVQQTIAAHRGIEKRAAYFEQVHEDVEEVLVRELRRRGNRRAKVLVDTLLYGDDPVGPDVLGLHLRLVPAPVVRRGARALLPLRPSVLERAAEEEDFDFPVEDYEPWRRLYREAARRGEVVIVLNA